MDPFPWQMRLLDSFQKGEIPRSLDIPTGLGKTATIAIWLVARSLDAKLPRRLIYVVDRRVVVDQATQVAEDLRGWVETNQEVREGLGLLQGPLPVSTLRGQFVDNRAWLEDPTVPAIVVGTVDMVGSRLLFEGYRASRRIRPYLAGLLSQDCLFVLDEAHLVPPFERLLERITRNPNGLGGASEAHKILPAPRLLSLSATGRSRGGSPFDLDEKDLAHPVVQARLTAKKRLVVEQLGSRADLAAMAAARAWAITGEGKRALRCVIFLSKRDDAEKAKNQLRSLAGLEKKKKGQEPPADVELLVGGRRIFERTKAAERLGELGFLADTKEPRKRPTFLVATSAGEVGIDLDADHMVSDLAPWERMVQRLGRVNRRGQGDSIIQMLYPALDSKTLTEEEIQQRQGVLDLLSRLPKAASQGDKSSHDVSPGALRDLQHLAREDSALSGLIEHASTPEPEYPPLERPTLEAWSMTSLRDHPGRPAVAPWLRGWVPDQPQTTVVWRRRLPLVPGRAPDNTMAKRFFEAAPIHTSEALDTETFRVSEWLIKRAKKLAPLATKNAESGVGDELLRPDDMIAVVRSDGGDALDWWTLKRLSEANKRELDRILPGADVIVDARFGGLSDGLLNAAEDEPPPTLDSELWQPVEVPFRVRESNDPEPTMDAGWRERDRLPIERDSEGTEVRWLVVDRRPNDSATEEDRSAGPPQLLEEHESWAASHANRIAETLLPEALRPLLVLAARLHDEGKRAPRWQLAFNAPKAEPGEAYAKTRGPLSQNVLDGYRHEFGSLPYAERDEDLVALPEDQKDLVLHLIASHHGYARPTIPTRSCDDAPPSALEARAQQVALRFMKLQNQWGPWGLAWWEALLRAADQQASRANDLRDRNRSRKVQK